MRTAATAGLFQFVWRVDLLGYELRQFGGQPGSVLSEIRYSRIVGKGGELRYYQPLVQHPGMWRTFATQCVSDTSAVRMAGRFGLLVGGGVGGADSPEEFMGTAAILRKIAWRLDENDHTAAADLFNAHGRPWLSAGVGSSAIEAEIVPLNLKGALYLQAIMAITRGTEFRQCRSCPTCFPIGAGAGTARKVFCSATCRVAAKRAANDRAAPHTG